MGLRLFPLSEDRTGFTIWNLIGAVDIGGLVVEIAPKTKPGLGWLSNLLALLLADDRISIAGELKAGLSQKVDTILEALSAIYATRLLAAVRRDGPIALVRRQHVEEPVLRGKIIVSDLVHRWFLRPGTISQERNGLTLDNDYSRALSFVAGSLANHVESQRTRASLLEAVTLLTPGIPYPAISPLGAEHRILPQQFAAYIPAWSIAVSILARRSLLGPIGQQFGVSFAIEPWPLLERLLERALAASCEQASQNGKTLEVPLKGSRVILNPVAGQSMRPHDLIPDGLLAEDGLIIASFEAKYRNYVPYEGPRPAEVYQAIAAARATSSPIAVLVYPGNHAAAVWEVAAAGQSPRYLATIGLDLFGYQQWTKADLGNRVYEVLARILWNSQ